MVTIKSLASYVHSVTLHKNLRTKVIKCANIYYNRKFFNRKVIPKYTNIKVSYTSPATNITQKELQTIRIKDNQI